jgi:hypothetical protein
MKLVVKIKIEPVTQASIILAVVAFSSLLLALIAIYSNSPLGSVLCTAILEFIVYLALCLPPC